MHKAIPCASDPLLIVYIDRGDPTAGVYYTYGDECDEPADQTTMFQTADMPALDKAAAEKVNCWIDA